MAYSYESLQDDVPMDQGEVTEHEPMDIDPSEDVSEDDGMKTSPSQTIACQRAVQVRTCQGGKMSDTGSTYPEFFISNEEEDLECRQPTNEESAGHFAWLETIDKIHSLMEQQLEVLRTIGDWVRLSTSCPVCGHCGANKSRH